MGLLITCLSGHCSYVYRKFVMALVLAVLLLVWGFPAATVNATTNAESVKNGSGDTLDPIPPPNQLQTDYLSTPAVGIGSATPRFTFSPIV